MSERRGWKLNHIGRGGDCLEEQEITGVFPDIGLGQDKPDFLFCLGGMPAVVVEAKNEAGKVSQALREATDYADSINSHGKYRVKIAVALRVRSNMGSTLMSLT